MKSENFLCCDLEFSERVAYFRDDVWERVLLLSLSTLILQIKTAQFRNIAW